MLRYNELHVSYFARGQDIFRKFPCDALCITSMGHKVAEELNAPLVRVFGTITSAHVYKSDLENAARICSSSQSGAPREILTSNASKYSSFSAKLAQLGLSLLVRDYKLPEIQSADPTEVISAKAKSAYDLLSRPVWVDDSYLITEAYEDFPGPLTKYILKALGISGLKSLFYGKSKKAKMVCLMACHDGNDTRIVRGEADGVLDLDNPILDPAMPLNSIFKCEFPMKHRLDAMEKAAACSAARN